MSEESKVKNGSADAAGKERQMILDAR